MGEEGWLARRRGGGQNGENRTSRRRDDDSPERRRAALLHLSPDVFSHAVSFSRAAISPRPSRTFFLSASSCLLLPFMPPLCSTLSFFRARNHRERKTPFQATKEEEFLPSPAPAPSYSSLFLARFARNGPKCKSTEDHLYINASEREYTGTDTCRRVQRTRVHMDARLCRSKVSPENTHARSLRINAKWSQEHLTVPREEEEEEIQRNRMTHGHSSSYPWDKVDEDAWKTVSDGGVCENYCGASRRVY